MSVSPWEIERAHEFVTGRLQRKARLDTFSRRLPPAHDRLVDVARAGETITYRALAEHADTNHRHYLSKILDGIGYIEEQRGNPPLTVLVVHADDGRPASEFIDLLDALGIRGRYSATTDEEALVDEISGKVHDYHAP